MKPTREVPFDQLIDLFIKTSGTDYILEPFMGEGSVRIFNLEKGLQAGLWDCTFSRPVELYSSGTSNRSPYFTLTFFLDTKDLQFAEGAAAYEKHRLWDNLFLSSNADTRLSIVPGMQVHCLSISFSRQWLDGVLEDCPALEMVKKQLYATDQLSVHGAMSGAEKALLLELVSSSGNQQLGSFYIKSVVLKMVSDFFCRLKERSTTLTPSRSAGAVLTEVAEYLLRHLTGPLPSLKRLAHTFSMSEPTLKRLFKKQYGVSMTTFFLQKKMEYAHRIMKENCLTLTEAAQRVGYRSTHNFISMFRKHYKDYMDRQATLSPA